MLNKYYRAIGKIVSKRYPDLIAPILKTITDIGEPKETDHKKIFIYFVKFCHLKGINPEEYRGALYKSSKEDIRRQFVGAIAHLYFPQAYKQPIEEIIRGRNGLFLTLAQVLGKHESGISKMIREAVTWEKEYDEYKEKITLIVKCLQDENGT